MNSNTMTGIMLLNMGGPDSLEAVKPFLENLFSDREIIRLGPSFLQRPIASVIIRRRLKKTINSYSLIGGKSPLPEITRQQASALEKRLNEDSEGQFLVSVGMRYWHPFIQDAMKDLKMKGIREVIGLSLYPQYSKATTGSTVKVFEESARANGISYRTISSWYDNPLYIDSLAEVIADGMRDFTRTPFVLFSAHSLPQRFVDEGDPYVKETEATVGIVTKKLSLSVGNWSLAYQSKTGPVKWVEPSTEDMLRHLARQGVKDVLMVPVSFVSDHIETLYEIDLLYKEMASLLGITLKRTEPLNTRVDFIDALKHIVIQSLK